MDSQDQQVLKTLKLWLAAGHRCWLCTIVETYGSSPRPVGSLLACNNQGEFVGSLSGGCVEEDLLQKIHDGAIASELPVVVEYGVSAQENERLGLPCGGRLTVVVEPWCSGEGQLDSILSRLSQRHCVSRNVDLSTANSSVEDSDHFSPLSFQGQQLTQTFGPRYQMLLIGAGQLSVCLAELAQMLDYRVLVCDPRPELIAQWPVAGVELLQQMPDDAVRERACDAYSIIITLTHDPRIDDMALMEALTTEAFYIGALGSKRTTEKRIDRLRALDLSEDHIKRLHAPVGLNIGSKAPMEIAISILAQLTQLRSQQKPR